jgi:hypothetical protein
VLKKIALARRRKYAWVQCPPPKPPDPVCEDGFVDFIVEFN